ncbi:MAG: hypothetical protein ACTIJ9_16645 [Aequorivita sp.]
MKTKTFITLFLLLSINAFSQEIEKIDISDNLEQLFINQDNDFGSIAESTVEKLFVDNLNIYVFELTYNDKVIYRESIKKSNPQSRDVETFMNTIRFKYDISIDDKLISDADKLNLLESYNNKIVKTSNSSFFKMKNFEILKKDYKQNKLIINHPLENMTIRIYKLAYN